MTLRIGSRVGRFEITGVLGEGALGTGSPLRLSGPMVHDLVLSAPGRRARTIGVLVAPNAGRDVAKVKETLKKE